MSLLNDRRDVTLLGTLLAGVTFFVLHWMLHRPSIWKTISKPFLSLGHGVKKEEEVAVHRGLRFRVLCAIHNIPQMILTFVSLADRSLWEDSLFGKTALSQLTIIITCGFFIWDITEALRHVRIDGGMPILHGVLCFTFLLYILMTDRFYFYGCASILWEVSTSFVHARWILFKIGLEKTSLYFYNGVAALISFAVFRICVGTRYVFGAVSAIRVYLWDWERLPEEIGALEKGLLLSFCFSGNLLNYYWFYKMVDASRRTIFSKSKPPSKETSKKIH